MYTCQIICNRPISLKCFNNVPPRKSVVAQDGDQPMPAAVACSASFMRRFGAGGMPLRGAHTNASATSCWLHGLSKV